MRRLLRRETTPLAGLSVAALAPFVDMMTLLLVVLLRTWASEPAPVPPEPGFLRAPSGAEAPRTRGAVEVVVGREALYVDGRRVVATAYLPEDAVVQELYAPLLALRARGRVEVHADARIPWTILRKVLHTARAAGFEEVNLVAESTGGL